MKKALLQNDSGDPATKKRESRRVFDFHPPLNLLSRIGDKLGEYILSYRTIHPDDPCYRETFSIDEDDYHVLVTMMLSFGIRGLHTIELELRSAVNNVDEYPYYNPKSFDSNKCCSDECLPVHDWKGDRVASLDLTGYPIRCLPSSIGRLDSLKYLALCYNRTLKTLPEDIRHLTNLEYLILEESYELLSLPEGIGCLSNLKLLVLSHASKMVSLPNSVSRLTNLLELNLGGMKSLKRLPEDIGNLANLEELALWHTGIETLPSSIGQLKKLKRLRLAKTKKLQKLPENIGDLISLEELELYDTIISSLPSSIGRLRNLKELNLEDALDFYELPDTIGGLEQLETINLRFTKISCLPGSFWQLKCLQTIWLKDTNIPDSDLAKLGLMLVKRLPLLSSIHIFSEPSDKDIMIEFFEKMNESKLRAIFVARSETSTRTNPKLWPHVLVKAMAEADRLQKDTLGEQWISKYDDYYHQLMAHGTQYVPNQADFIYQLLFEGREAFLDALRDENC